MRRHDRRRASVRRLPINVEGLEARQLMSATKVNHDSFMAELSVVRAEQHAALISRTLATAETTNQLSATSAMMVARHSTFGASSQHSIPFSPYIIYPTTPNRIKGQSAFSPPGGAIFPSQMSTAYGLNQLPASNQGQGVTIAIVDELVDPTITSDVAAFSTQFGLPQLDGKNGDGSFATINDTALGTPGTSPPGGTSIETALDVEWAHSMAPKANILLVFVPATGDLNNAFAQILHGVQFAATPSTASGLGLPPVVVVSTSYGYFEGTVVDGTNTFQGFTPAEETSLNSTYLSTGAATNVALTFSSGDYSLPLFPAVSPNVIAVGGTSLYPATARGRYGYELAWGGIDGDGAGGGGVSAAFTTVPAFQLNAGVNLGGRAIPDISMDADPITGVPVYSANDESINNGDPWFQIGGTSLASPMFAGVIALAQQNLADASLPILNSVAINNDLYNAYVNHYKTYFHDIVLGNNNAIGVTRFIIGTNPPINIIGSNATTGYDLATGIGSPIGNEIVSLLSTPPPS
jgi:subtilase family serine protease